MLLFADVSMHTAMLTLPLGDVVKHPADTLTKVLTYIWKENWDWEGQGEEANEHKQQNPPGGWRRAAEDLIAKDRGGHLEGLLDRTATLIQETTPGLRGDGDVFKTALQGAFAAEMKRSNDMTAWPCPSFWEGVEADGGAAAEEAVRRIAGETVPDCGDDHPFARCTIKRDKVSPILHCTRQTSAVRYVSSLYPCKQSTIDTLCLGTVRAGPGCEVHLNRGFSMRSSGL